MYKSKRKMNCLLNVDSRDFKIKIPFYPSWEDVCRNEGFQEQQQRIILLNEDDDQLELDIYQYYDDDDDTTTEEIYSGKTTKQIKQCKLLRILDVRRRQRDDVDATQFSNDLVYTTNVPLVFDKYEYQQKPVIRNKNSVTESLDLSANTIAMKIVRIPIDELYERRFELPPRHVMFAVLLDNQSCGISNSGNECTNDDECHFNQSNLYDLRLVHKILLRIDDKIENYSHCKDYDVTICNTTKENESETNSSDKHQQKESIVAYSRQNMINPSSILQYNNIQSNSKPWNVSFFFMISQKFLCASLLIDNNSCNNQSGTFDCKERKIQQQEQKHHEDCSKLLETTKTKISSDDNVTKHDQPVHVIPIRMQNRFWKPDPMIQYVLAPILSQHLVYTQQQHQLQQNVPMNEPRNHTINNIKVDNVNVTTTNDMNKLTNFEIWDLGAGIGRDVCYLAEYLKMVLLRDDRSRSSTHTHSNVVAAPVTSTTTTTTTDATNTSTSIESLEDGSSSNHLTFNNVSSSVSVAASTTVVQPNPLLPFTVVAYDQRYREEHHKDVTTKFLDRYNVSDIAECRLWNWKTTVDIISTGGLKQNRNCIENIQQPSLHNIDDNNSCNRCTINTTAHLVQTLQSMSSNSSKSILCMYSVRFWNRQLFQTIATLPNKPNNLFVAISHFCKPKLISKWNFKHPKVGVFCTDCF
jgi:hypothetical protein